MGGGNFTTITSTLVVDVVAFCAYEIRIGSTHLLLLAVFVFTIAPLLQERNLTTAGPDAFGAKLLVSRAIRLTETNKVYFLKHLFEG